MCPNGRKEKTQRGREDEEEGRFLEPERFAEGWRLGAAVRREDLSGSRHREREGESERHTDRGVCVVSVDVIGCLCVCVCVTERDQQKAERVDTTPHDWLHLDSQKESTQPQ